MEKLYLRKISMIGTDEVKQYGTLSGGITIYESIKLNKFYLVNELDDVICIFFSDDAIDCLLK